MKERRYKVLLIGSASPHVSNCLDRIVDGPFDIEVISNSDSFLKSKQRITLVDFSLYKLKNWFRTPRVIRNQIKEFNPDVIHIHQANSVAFYSILANRRLRKPVVLTAWGSDILLNPKKSILLKWMVKYILRNVDACTSDSTFMAEEIKRLCTSKSFPIEICNFGVAESTIQIEKGNIIYSNRTHNPLYRIEEVIHSFNRFIQKDIGEKWKLIIAGRGSETEKLKELVIELNLTKEVEFVGFVDAKANSIYYSQAQFFISLPESDATAMSLLEAMYYKCVPILVDLPANKEWVKNGKNGIIVADLSSNFILSALNINFKEAGDYNRTIIEEKGTIAISERKFRDVLLKTIKK